MKKIKIFDKTFTLYIPEKKINETVLEISNKIQNDFFGEEVIFLAILNGAFMFASDLLKNINFNCKISFLKLMSYNGKSTAGKIKELIGLNENISGKDVIIVEDIIDSGYTIQSICRQLIAHKPKQIKIASLFFKPELCKANVKIDYLGLEIPDKFILGYGLDYMGYGRNLKDIYCLES